MSAVDITRLTSERDNFGRNYILALVTLIYSINYMDRQILNMLLPQIKDEFHLSDTQLGLLAGPVFASVYSINLVVFAGLADRINRRNLIGITLALFSAATFVSGLASNFAQLLLSRFVTGVGEAGTQPAASAIISDLFPTSSRATALGIYAGGLNIGLLLAFFGGGWVAEHSGWRVAFMLAGLPGFALLLLLLSTVQEPRRGYVENLPDLEKAGSTAAAAKFLFSNRAFCLITAGASLCSFAGYAGLVFNPSFLVRTHHLTTSETGLVLALFSGICGLFGTAGAGFIADYFGQDDARWGMWISVLGVLVALPFFPIFYLSNGLATALIAGAIPAALATSYMAPAFAAVQAIAPLRMRAKAQALLLVVVNLVGLGLGPQWVGALSDFLHPWFGDASLRYAMVSTIVPLFCGAVCFSLAAKSMRDNRNVAAEVDIGTSVSI